MRLWIANTTLQNWTVSYRINAVPGTPFSPAPQMPIKGGANAKEIYTRQVVVGGDLEQHQVDMIIDQLKPHGLIMECDVPNRMRGIFPLVGNIDRRVSEHVINIVKSNNMGIKIHEGEVRRERAAIGVNEALNIQAREAQLPPPPEFDVEFEQMEQFNDEPRLEKGFHVKRDLAEVPPDVIKKRGPGRPRKAAN
jgi:hypothetical protein